LNECDLRSVHAGRESIAGDRPRHRHLEPYAIVVVRGAFEQTSYGGRVRVCSGELLVQPTLDCHANQAVTAGVQILRLPWRDVDDLGGVYALDDLDAIVRTAERDLAAAGRLAAASARVRRAGAEDWPDLLAAAMVGETVTSFAAWAEELGVARETVSRGFAAAYGVPARRFRAELRARAAWLRIVRTDEPLAAIAHGEGFADQAHMTRGVRALTGASPVAWRRDARAARFTRRALAAAPGARSP
jgi:AraC-like DNA-binding protein